MSLFNEKIENWDDWGNIFQSIPAFTPLVEFILKKEKLPVEKIEKLTPGTNAVFKVGEYVIKIFAPSEFGQDFGTDVDVELFGMRWANANGVPAPRLIAHGEIEDRYLFRYMVMDYIHGELLGAVEDGLSYEDKVIIGRKVREITDKLNKPCENFTPVDLMQYALEDDEWEDEGFPDSFQAERLEYLKKFPIDEYKKVYCHGDFNVDNVLVDDKLNVYIVDFADAMYAPAEYEQVYIASGLFCFEKPYMLGYFGNYDIDEIVDLCMKWLPVHVWGHSTVAANLKPAKEITSFDVMKKRLLALIKKEYLQ